MTTEILWAFLVGILLIIHLRDTNHLAEVNKQLMILVAGKDQKPEALRALVALNKPPQKKLKGIAGEKKDVKSKNTDYVMEVGVG